MIANFMSFHVMVLNESCVLFSPKRREKAKLQRFTNFTPPGRDTFRGYCVTWSRKQPPDAPRWKNDEDCTLWVYPCGNSHGNPGFTFWEMEGKPFSHIFASNHFPNNGVGPSTAEVPRPLHLWVAAYSWGCSNHSYGGYIPTSGGPCLYPLVTPHCSPNRPHGHRLAISAGDAMSISVAVKLQMSPKTMVQRVESSTCSPKFSGYTQNIHNSPKQTKESTSMEDFNIPNGH